MLREQYPAVCKMGWRKSRAVNIISHAVMQNVGTVLENLAVQHDGVRVKAGIFGVISATAQDLDFGSGA
jgi:hypothetical protein